MPRVGVEAVTCRTDHCTHDAEPQSAHCRVCQHAFAAGRRSAFGECAAAADERAAAAGTHQGRLMSQGISGLGDYQEGRRNEALDIAAWARREAGEK